ncbi:hypothetical protein B9Z55_026424 [Caenorhabditis nigoni]|uniref:PHD-type domain-containing protein n=1 Tax=Caenorhabditis nigoni TaxID=1611254 RepID=A0A2G5T3J2_9PELO|nr:hypothetical protein B9Z55_026424 [Caenorhabditis nigoni]
MTLQTTLDVLVLVILAFFRYDLRNETFVPLYLKDIRSIYKNALALDRILAFHMIYFYIMTSDITNLVKSFWMEQSRDIFLSHMHCLQLNPSHFPLSQLFRDSCNFPMMIAVMSSAQLLWNNHKSFPAKSFHEKLSNGQRRQEALRLFLVAIFEFDLGLCCRNHCHTMDQRRKLLWDAFEADRSFICHIVNFLIFVGGEMSRSIIGGMWVEQMRARGVEIPPVVSTHDGSQQMLDQHLLDLLAILIGPLPTAVINGSSTSASAPVIQGHRQRFDWDSARQQSQFDASIPSTSSLGPPIRQASAFDDSVPSTSSRQQPTRHLFQVPVSRLPTRTGRHSRDSLIQGFQGPSTSRLPQFGSQAPTTSTTVPSTSSVHPSTSRQGLVSHPAIRTGRNSTDFVIQGFQGPSTSRLPRFGFSALPTSTMPPNNGKQVPGKSTPGVKNVQTPTTKPPSPPRKRRAARDAAEKIKNQKVEEMIKCDDCGQWFHGFCLYLVNTKSVLPDDFSCCGFQPNQEALDGVGGVVFRRYHNLPNPKPTPESTYRP